MTPCLQPRPPRLQVGGNCNFMVAASRLGLATASVGHIGTDIYGSFMDEVLRVSQGGAVGPSLGQRHWGIEG
jgi:hypothetical protein